MVSPVGAQEGSSEGCYHLLTPTFCRLPRRGQQDYRDLGLYFALREGARKGDRHDKLARSKPSNEFAIVMKEFLG